ncbi:hypothetical protein [uncultured Modestobacter sp.]|uniref:hypothetical protein n=1 Tax=uncultured Modestobacter sp. TaxID=380048 RepID=UPI00260FF6A2|nr:hypothetical protein [uncultured Modestobacter sp.]
MGTRYRLHTGEVGGDDAPWRVAWRYLPAPPPEARELLVDVAASPTVVLSLPAG